VPADRNYLVTLFTTEQRMALHRAVDDARAEQAALTLGSPEVSTIEAHIKHLESIQRVPYDLWIETLEAQREAVVRAAEVNSHLHALAHAAGQAVGVLDDIVDGGTLADDERAAAERAATALIRAVANAR
jgi:hypothetical protein